jgi:hypothetical protein
VGYKRFVKNTGGTCPADMTGSRLDYSDDVTADEARAAPAGLNCCNGAHRTYSEGWDTVGSTCTNNKMFWWTCGAGVDEWAGTHAETFVAGFNPMGYPNGSAPPVVTHADNVAYVLALYQRSFKPPWARLEPYTLETFPQGPGTYVDQLDRGTLTRARLEVIIAKEVEADKAALNNTSPAPPPGPKSGGSSGGPIKTPDGDLGDETNLPGPPDDSGSTLGPEIPPEPPPNWFGGGG